MTKNNPDAVIDDNTKTELNNRSKESTTNFKESLQEDMLGAQHELDKNFKKACSWVKVKGVYILLFLFTIISLALCSGFITIFYHYILTVVSDANKSQIFMSHAWTFFFGLVTAISGIYSIPPLRRK